MKKTSVLFCCAVVLLLQNYATVQAQKTRVHQSEFSTYKKALELYEKAKYGAAQRQFGRIKEGEVVVNPEVKASASYYHALCAIQLFNRDADFLLREFIREYPSSPLLKKSYFQLGKFNYRKRDWKKTIQWFSKVDVFELSEEETAEYYFSLGYAYFNEKEVDKALKQFFEIKDTENAFNAPANYYYAHINYEQNKLETALKGFKRLQNHPKFKVIVPYYIAQILYKQGKFDEVLEYAPQYIDSISEKRKTEFARIIGDAYYENKNYKEALPFLELYASKARSLTKEEKYQIGYAYFQLKDWAKAEDKFSALARFEDEIAQASLYHLGECYLKRNDKTYARNAFYEAQKLNYDDEISKDALYRFAVLSYELQYDPYNSSIDAFTEFIQKYPHAEEVDQAYTYLINVYLTSKNYDRALASIEKINQLDYRLKEAYQLIAYNKATESFLNEDYPQALDYYTKSQKYPIDELLNAKTAYWQAESHYQLKNFLKAIEKFQKFMYTPRGILTGQYQLAHYNLGYAYFKRLDYVESSKWFRKYVNFGSNQDSLRITDAYNRIGDCYFISKRFDDAIGFYSQAYNVGKVDADYALFQKAISQGINKNRDEKIATLNLLSENYPKSKFIDATHYELGRSYLLKQDELTALKYFQSVVDSTPNSIYVKKSLVNTGLIYFNQRNNNKALDVFKRVVKDYPTYEDTREALAGIRNIYVENGKVDEYENYINSLDFVDISKATLDSTTYESAELRYVEGDFLNAIEAFTRYLNRFNPANFRINAMYYRANSYQQIGAEDKALPDLEVIAMEKYNKFTETAVRDAADISYGLDSLAKAEKYYKQLEQISLDKSNQNLAEFRLLEINYKLQDIADIREYAPLILSKEKLTTGDWVKTNFYLGKSLYWEGNKDSAYQYFELVSDTSTSKLSAEANYYMAEILVENKQYEEAERELFNLVNRVPSYHVWIAKGLILLGDIYVEINDLFQAKATYKSIIENYEGEDLRQIAQEKYDKVLALEEPEEVKEESNDIDIELFDNEELEFDSRLFEPEIIDEETQQDEK